MSENYPKDKVLLALEKLTERLTSFENKYEQREFEKRTKRVVSLTDEDHNKLTMETELYLQKARDLDLSLMDGIDPLITQIRFL